LEKGASIRRVRVVVRWYGAVSKFFPNTLNLGDTIIETVQVLLRPRLPVAERRVRDRQKRGSERRRIRHDGSTEKKEPVRSDDDKRGVGTVSIHPDTVERPFAQLAEVWLLLPSVRATGVDLHIDCVLAEVHHHARCLGIPLLTEMTLQPGATERAAHLRAIVVDGTSLAGRPMFAQLIHRFRDRRHFKNIAAAIA